VCGERRLEFREVEGSDRLDRFLARRLDGVSRSRVQRWIRDGRVRVNGQLEKASHSVGLGDVVTAVLPREKPLRLEPWNVPLRVLYEDALCAVVEKPACMVVHPAPGHRRKTLVHALLGQYPEIASMADPHTERGLRPGIVHRLDKNTSGVIVVARQEAARAALQEEFRERRVEKAYLALLYGWLASPTGRIRATIGRDERNRQRMTVIEDGGAEAAQASPRGKDAETAYSTRQFLFTPHGAHDHYTLIEARPLTGRTHQIRVHMAHIGHPIVGDAVYGRRKSQLACPRQFLHASRLGFYRPTDGKWISVESALPDELCQVLSHLESVV